MKILVCNYEYPPLGGGGGVSNALLAQAWVAQGHEVTVLTTRGADLPAEAVEGGVRVLRVAVLGRTRRSVASLPSMVSFLPAAILAGRPLLRTNAYDVINTHFVLPTGPVGHALSRFSGIPNVLSLHGGDLYDPSKSTSPHRHPLLRAWIRRMLLQADAVVGQSQNTLENMRRYYAAEIAGIQIPLGIPIPPLAPAARSNYGLAADDHILVTVGRLIARKAVDQLIQLLAKLAAQSSTPSRTHLMIIGSGPLEGELREEATRLGLGNQVHFLGQVEDAEKFGVLQMSDLYVSTSQHEGFGLVFLEAMACGLPVVCYDHGGQSDFLADGITGAMAPLNQLDRLTAACQHLLEHPALCTEINVENRRRAAAFSAERCADQYVQLFAEILHGRREEKHAPSAMQSSQRAG